MDQEEARQPLTGEARLAAYLDAIAGVLGHARRAAAAQAGVAVSLSVANDHASLPIAYRLFLPEAWANDPLRRAKAGVPAAIGFASKTAIALGQLRQARTDGVPVGTVLGDPASHETAFRVSVAALGLRYMFGVRSGTSVWPPGHEPLPPAPWSGRGRPATRLRRDAEHRPVTLKALACRLPARAWRSLTWRTGTQGALALRFAAVRVRPAHRDTQRSEPWP
jgi:SRSO17 transposase